MPRSRRMLTAFEETRGELLLWVYEPKLPQAARDELLSGRAKRSSQAQMQACGFDFKLLTMRCAEPAVSLGCLVEGLVMLSDEHKADLIARADELAARRADAWKADCLAGVARAQACRIAADIPFE